MSIFNTARSVLKNLQAKSSRPRVSLFNLSQQQRNFREGFGGSINSAMGALSQGLQALDPYSRRLRAQADAQNLATQQRILQFSKQRDTKNRIQMAQRIGQQPTAQQQYASTLPTNKQVLISGAKTAGLALSGGLGAGGLGITGAFTAPFAAYEAKKTGQPLSRVYGRQLGDVLPYGGLTRGVTTPFISRFAPQAALGSRVGQAGLNVLENTALNYGTGQPLFQSAGFAALTGLAGKPFVPASTKSNFKMDQKTLDELVEAEQMLRFPKEYVGKTSTGARTSKDAEKIIRERGKAIIDRIAGKYLPDKQMNTVKNPLSVAKALFDLNRENKLANVPVAGIKSQNSSAQAGLYDAPTKEIKRVADNLQKHNDGLSRIDAEAMARDVIGNRPFNVAQQPLSVKISTSVPQTMKTQLQSQASRLEVPGAKPQVPGEVGVGGGGSSQSIIPPQDKYAFNINKPRLGLEGEAAQKLDAVVEQMRPVLERRKGAPLTNKQIITDGRKGVMLGSVMSRQESAEFSSALQASRNFLKSESSKKGLSPEFLSQLEIVSSHASDKGRSLRAFAVDAENVTIKEALVRDLQKLGIRTERLIEASKNVDWDNAQQVTEFYRKFKPASILEMLEEYRYTNMLSSPNTQIVNAFSNLIQGGIVTPIEKTLTGSLDFVRSRLTGTEQKYFASQGVDFAKGYWKALPEGWKKFKSIVSGEGGLRKPDVDFIPTGTGKFHKIYTTPLRALEATDQLFRTMVIGGETASLKRAGVEGAEAALKAEAEATYRTFRQAFDPEGKLGQGGLLKLWDKWNVGINQLRHLPGGKWIVPFLQTPTNILKQGVEYSPLGVATIPGSREPMVQLSKSILGTGVFATAYAFADAGLTTWDVPTNKKDKDAFYAAGLQPYSVKIGDRWVSYSKLGPLSYPIAMAAAMKWAKDNGANDSLLKTAGTGVGGFLQFFADQSYMQGIGDIIDAARGDEFKQGRSLANIPSQLIPYRAFQAWIARLVDPVYRKTSGGGILEQAGKSIVSQIPFASKSLEPYTTSKGESLRSEPLLNAFSPVRTSRQTESYLPASSKGIYGEFSKLKTPQEKAALWDEMIKQGRITKDNVSDIKKLFKDEKLGVTDKEREIREMGVKDGSRARSVAREFSRLKTREEKIALWDKYVEAGIITKDVAKQLKILLAK